jgi:uncharacterized membrane protein required for colicin V production
MWKAFTIIVSTVTFSLIGLLVQWNKLGGDDRALGAILGGVAGFIVGYLSIIIAVSSEKPKP